MKRFSVIFTAVFLCMPLLPSAAKAEGSTGKPKNFIMMVMDGTNSDAVTLARWYKGRKLALDDILAGGARTYSYRSAITDSAAAGTALATGRKTIIHSIGMTPADQSGMLKPGTEGSSLNPGRQLTESALQNSLVPAASILEAAKQAGKATGLVSTSPIQHATPAAFSAHVENRANFDDIAEQQVYQGIDVVLGGGMNSLLPERRRDREDLVKVIFNSGYAFADKRTVMEQAGSGKLWGAFAPDDIANELDRKRYFPQQPSLAGMTKKALQSLSKNKNGFFLFVEGSKVDWAAHLNDPVGMISEILGFDDAVKEALDFAKKDKNTLVVAVTDHGNSGLSIGSHKTDSSYAVSPPEEFIKPLKKAKVTLEGAMRLLKKDHSNLKEVADHYGITDLTAAEWKALNGAKTDLELQKQLSSMLGSRAKLGFTTYGHTGEDVFLYAYGPGKPDGLVNNVDIAPLAAGYWGVNLDELSGRRFKDGAGYYKALGYTVSTNLKNPANPELVAKKGQTVIRIPANKNNMIKNGKTLPLKGVTVYVRGKFYLSTGK
ncbi:alkaline phosphatase [Peribacillus kribbensis]|uniref:alkaline phosphatase n=1 Tax=Peribacillus kribbensis TaxID=356658 RepID=UPI0003FFEB7E|nr:alkaline phosphatase [Peribacillus kribbensis]